MKKLKQSVLIAAIGLAAFGLAWLYNPGTAHALSAAPAAPQGAGFRLTSNDLKPGGRLPEAQVLNGMGYTGGNKSPQLSWSNPPAGTQSFVVTAYDPDAPTGSGWWHWVVINIPASTRELPGGIGADGTGLPAGALQTRTDFGKPGYGGAAPPPGKPHRYIFTVYALKVPKLDLNADSSAAMVGFMTNMNSLGKASITAMYGK